MPGPDRRHARVASDQRIRLAGGAGVPIAERSATDVSRGVAFVRALEPRPARTRLTLDLARSARPRAPARRPGPLARPFEWRS